MKVVTTDLYCGAYLLSRGGLLEEIQVTRRAARPSVLFIFSGPEVLLWEQEFRSGQATVSLSLFKANMLHLKDLMFDRLRGETRVEKGDEDGVSRERVGRSQSVR